VAKLTQDRVASQWAFTAKPAQPQDILLTHPGLVSKKSGGRKILVRMEAEVVKI